MPVIGICFCVVVAHKTCVLVVSVFAYFLQTSQFLAFSSYCNTFTVTSSVTSFIPLLPILPSLHDMPYYISVNSIWEEYKIAFYSTEIFVLVIKTQTEIY